MALVNKILVPIDFSPCSLAALAYASSLAVDHSASATVLHVLPLGPARAGDPRLDEALELAQSQLADAVVEAKGRLGDRLSAVAEAGDPLTRIVETAIAGEYDLVVMGTHGRIGRLHMLAGSVAETVVRNAPCPVVTVRVASGERESFSERLHGESHFEPRAVS